MMNPKLQELEYAAHLLFASQLVSVEQHHAAEQVFLNFKAQASPYKFCQEIFQQSNNDYVLYQAVTTLKAAIVREWSFLNKTETDFWLNFLLAFVCERRNLQKYVIEKSLQCIAVIIKRGTLDDSAGYSSLQSLMGNVHQLFVSNDLHMKLIGCSMMKALLFEYSSVGQSSDIKMSFEFHCKCKAHFETQSLQQFFITTIQALQTFTSISTPFTKEHIAVLGNLLSVTESILSWTFSPKNPLRAFHSRGNEAATLILFKPGPTWRECMVNGNALEIFFNLKSCLNDNEQLLHRYFLCLTQFASLTGTVFSDDSSIVQYLGHLLQGILHLVHQFSQVSGVIACGFASVVNRITTVFSISSVATLPTELVKTYLHAVSLLTQNFLQAAMRNEELHNDDTSHMEAFDQLLIAWVNILSGSNSFPKDFLSAPCLQILHLYIRTHISAPEGTRNPQGVQDLEEFVELRDTDLEEFDEQLSAVAKLARHVLGDALPFLNHMLEVKIATFMEHLCTLKEKGPLAVDTVKTENLYEDLHWIILIAGHILSDDVLGEKALIPDEIMMHSVAESENVHMESTVKYLTSLGTDDTGDKRIDSVTRLITLMLRVADLEKQALAAGLGPILSPELGGNIVWILRKVCDVYLMFSEPDYGQISVALVAAFGKGSQSAQWFVKFILGKVLSNLHGWLSEPSVLENTAQLLVTLMSNKTNAHAAISCDVIAQLAKDYAENNSYVKDLPALVQRELSRALVIAGSAIEHDSSRKQYLSQILNPIKARFLSVVQAPMFRKECQHEAFKEEVERLLQCFRGAAKATDRRNVSFLFSFLVPVLEDCVPLFELYHNCSETVEILLSLLLDVVDSQLGFLTKAEWPTLHKICVSLMEVYSKHSLGRLNRSILAEEETFLDLLIFIKILSTIVNKEFFDFSVDEVHGEYTPGDGGANVVLYGLNILMPFITPELLKFPELKEEYFKLITFVCEEHFPTVCLMPDHLFANLMVSLEKGLTECGSDIAKSTLEALSSMALDLFRDQQQKTTITERSAALKSMLKILFNFLLYETFDVVDLLIPAADAFRYLICCHQEEYTNLVQNLLASQTDAAVRQRLIDSFNKLIPPDANIANDKNYKETFRKNLDSFLANVKGLLCVR
ncbi:exportin-4-like isoform X2 [Dendronephthya gigantea]|uniref:exportin-4-like isoform X2 n=1 Tax=Dendronephthya gigantea TaxID=151771 RepID=UPI00106CA8CD|nr:exportin-4-like isoform X2 [Dendronephthya gigantea]